MKGPGWPMGGDVRTEGRTDGCLEIHPCVLQDIGPLGPLPKKWRVLRNRMCKRFGTDVRNHANTILYILFFAKIRANCIS